MGQTGESVRRIASFGYNPSWSPDSRQIVFASASVDITPDYVTSELWTVDVDQGKPRKLPGAEGALPAWSPNGHRIAYYTIRPKRNRDIMTIAVGGGEPVSVPDRSERSFSPTWSPDGKSIAFSAWRRLGAR